MKPGVGFPTCTRHVHPQLRFRLLSPLEVGFCLIGKTKVEVFTNQKQNIKGTENKGGRRTGAEREGKREKRREGRKEESFSHIDLGTKATKYNEKDHPSFTTMETMSQFSQGLHHHLGWSEEMSGLLRMFSLKGQRL